MEAIYYVPIGLMGAGMVESATTTVEQFLSNFHFQGGLLQLTIGSLDNALYFPEVPMFEGSIPTNRNVYFSPAMRSREGADKEDVLGTRAAWADVDHAELPDMTFPPSIIVWSGRGWHLYWKLTRTITNVEMIEGINQIICADVPEADKCWNANRLLRLPYTYNVKDPANPIQSRIDRINESLRYAPEDFDVLARLDDRTRRLIRSGDATGFDSRSERDWAVITALLGAGATDPLIELLFDNQPVGDKYRAHTSPEHYLSTTIVKAREAVSDKVHKVSEQEGRIPSVGDKKKRAPREHTPVMITEGEDGYYIQGASKRRVSTFTLDPTVLLDGSAFGQEDALVCTVHANGHVWNDVTFPRKAFRSVAMMDASTPLAAWQWLGQDTDVRLLLPFLVAKLDALELPRVVASPALGLHYIKGVPYFLGDKETIGPEGYYEGKHAPITWLPTGREHPEVSLRPVREEAELERIKEHLFNLNTPNVMWSMVGWYAASLFKPWLEQQHYRFPTLNVTGTKGSGKTTLSQRILMPLFGQKEAKGYDAGTTKFVMLSLLGSSNAVPIAFSEFRYDRVEKFITFILLAYDTGHDPRGRADQTTQDYPLSAPFSVDGEDVIADAAARERIIVARLRPDTIAEGSNAHKEFTAFRENVPTSFGGYFAQFAISSLVDGTAMQLLREASALIHRAFPDRLPDRVRNNFVVAMFGALMFAKAVGMEAPNAEVFTDSILEIVNTTSGRSRTLVDEFTEACVNAVNQGAFTPFKFEYDSTDNILYLQVTPAHSWWLGQRRRQGRGGLERDAILAQLKEATFGTGGALRQGIWMHGISLEQANKEGLDIPNRLSSRRAYINIPD